MFFHAGESSLNKLQLKDTDVKGKRVFIRVDFNVPFDKKDPTKITNLARVQGALPTIQYCLEKGAVRAWVSRTLQAFPPRPMETTIHKGKARYEAAAKGAWVVRIHHRPIAISLFWEVPKILTNAGWF